MAIKFNRSQTFATNGTVTATGLHNLVDGLDIYQALITDQTNLTSVGTADELLIADADLTPADAPRAVTVQELFNDALTAGTYTDANLTGNLTFGTATGNRTASTSASITTGTINNATLGTTTGTAANITSGTIQTLTSSTLASNLTGGTYSGVINSTTGTFGGLINGSLSATSGTITTLTAGTSTSTAATITTGTIPTLASTTLLTIGTGTAATPAIVPAGDTNTGIFFPADDTIASTTNGTERLRIMSDGVVLFAKNTANVGTVGYRFDTTGEAFTSLSSTTNAMATNYIYSTGATAYRFYVGMAGTVFATNTTISAISDARLKENIRDIDSGLQSILALKPRMFDWKEGKGTDKKNVRGFIAQEIEQVFPDLVDEWKDPAPEGEEPYKSVRQDLIPVLVKAIQELKAENDSLKSRIEALEAA